MADLGECGWEADLSCVDPSKFPTEVWTSALTQAVEILWALTGRRFGACPVVLRPCRRCTGNPCGRCPGIGYWGRWSVPWTPALIGGEWFNITCTADHEMCDCTVTVPRVRLPGPVAEILEVRVDGQVLPVDAYRVYDYLTLVRTDGGLWPQCQDLTKDDTEPGTWSVTYRRGESVPEGAQRAVAILAQALAKACSTGKCEVPWQVTQVTRDGVTWEVDPSQFFTVGLTGIPAVDMWISAVNPRRQLRKPAVYSIDLNPNDHVQTWPLIPSPRNGGA